MYKKNCKLKINSIFLIVLKKRMVVFSKLALTYVKINQWTSYTKKVAKADLNKVNFKKRVYQHIVFILKY